MCFSISDASLYTNIINDDSPQREAAVEGHCSSLSLYVDLWIEEFVIHFIQIYIEYIVHTVVSFFHLAFVFVWVIFLIL